MVVSCGRPYGMYAASAWAPDGAAAAQEPSGCLCLEPAMAELARGDAGSWSRAAIPRDLPPLLLPMLALPAAGTVKGRGGSKQGGGGGRAATRGSPRGEGTAVEARGGGEDGLRFASASGLGFPLEARCKSLSRAASSCAHAALLSAVEGRARSGGGGTADTWSSCVCMNGLSAAPSQKMLTWEGGGGAYDTQCVQRCSLRSAYAERCTTAGDACLHGACLLCECGMRVACTGGLASKSLAALPSPRGPPCSSAPA